MSEILISGMEMPKTESEVLIIAIKSDGSVYPVRIDGEGQPMIFPNEEMKNCAVNVPPHGRLVDADVLKKKRHWTDDFYETEYVEVEDIDSAPTIIPASE